MNPYILLAIYVLLYSLTSTGSVVILGDKSLISGNLLSPKNIFSLVMDYRFMIAMFLAFVTRFIFILINNTLLKIPSLAQNSTTITAFITLISAIFLVSANYYFLNERLNSGQIVGVFVILFGVFLILK